MKIGILGGTFNPPHIGHIILAQEAQLRLGLDKIFFIPTNIPPHKASKEADSKHRFNMVQLMIEGEDCFAVMDLELKRGGVSYTVDTVRQLKAQFPQDDFVLIFGSDLANDFYKWKRFDELKRAVKIVVAQRKETLFKDKNDFSVIDIIQIGISSSMIRERIREGKPIKNLVKDNVFQYIKEHRLYET